MYRDGTGASGHDHPTALVWRCGLAASIGAVLLAIDRVVTTTGATTGWLGRLLAHGDLGRSIVLVAVTIAVLGHWLRDDVGGASASAWLSRGAVIVYSLWLTVVVATIAAVHPARSARQLLTTLVFFRPIGSGTIIDGLGIGTLVLEIALVAAAAPFVARFVRSRNVRDARRMAAVVAGAGLAIRVFAIATDHRSPTGILSTLLADLDLVGFGVLAALGLTRPAASGTGSMSSSSSRRPSVAVMAAGIAVIGFVVLGAVVQQAVVPGTESTGAALLQAVLGVIIAAAIVIAVTQSTWLGHWRRTIWWITITLPGVLLLHEALLVVIARQYVERASTTVGGLRLTGPSMPPLLWSLLVAGAIGVALSAVLLQPLVHGLLRRNASNWYALSAAGVVSIGFIWRVIALLTIAPVKVDGGDPLFYHTTANTIAAGRGFPEPLNWIAYGTEIKSAVHGPLFPFVLSFFSRLGGTTYFDHRMGAALIGSVVVLGVLFVGHYLGGRTVALIAGVIASFYPNLWLIDGVLFPEGLMAALVVFTMLAAYRWNDRPGWRLAAGLGALVGLSALARGEGIFLMALLVLPLMIRKRTLVTSERLKHFGLACIACLAVITPWTVRNLNAFQQFVPLSTNSNEVLTYANCDDTYSGKFMGFWVFDCQQRIREALGEPEGDESEKAAYWRKVGIDYITDHADRLPVVVLARVGRQWEVFRPWQNTEFAPIEGRNQTGAQAGLISYYGLVALGINGVRILRRRRIKLLPLTAQLLSVTITAAAAYGTVRFRAPAEPVLCLLAAVGIAPWLSRLRRRAVVPADEVVPIVDEDAFVLGGRAVRRRWSWPTFTGIGIAAFVALFPVRGMYHSTGGTMEEGFMLSFPERMLKGAVANVDFLHLYGPGSLDVLAGWYSLFGVRLGAERTFGLIQHLAIIAGLYVIARAWGRAAACATAVLSVFLIMTPIGLTAMAWNGGVALGLWSVIAGVRARNMTSPTSMRRMYVLAGVLAGLALTYRPDLGLALLITHGWLLWRMRADRPEGTSWWRPSFTQHWKPFGIGGAVGLLPLIVHVARIGPGTAIRTMLIDPVVKLRPGRELPRPPSWNHLDGALQAIAETVPPWWRFPAIAPSHQLFIWFFALPVLALLVVVTGVLVHRRTGGAPRSFVLIAAGLFGVGLLPQAFQRPDSTHLTWVACVSWPLLVPTLIELIQMRAPRTHPRLRVAISAGLVAALMFVVCPFFTYRTYVLYARITVGNLPPAYEVHRGDRIFFMGDLPPARATQGVIDTLDRLSKPGERLLVGPVDLRRTWYSDTFFYYMFPELPPATQFMEMDPGIADAPGSPLADEVASADWVLLTSFWAGWNEPNTAMDFGPDEPNQVVRDQFCLVQSFENGLVDLYHRCDEPLP